MNEHPFDLQRFVDAQDPVYERALAELRAGRKRGHWIWFILPQLRGLGRSRMAQYYGITACEEAKAYLAHPLLGPRLRECVEAVLGHAGTRSAEEMLGPVDAVKLRSCLTLFGQAGGGELFDRALAALFGGCPDEATMRLLRSGRGSGPAGAAPGSPQ